MSRLLDFRLPKSDKELYEADSDGEKKRQMREKGSVL